MLNWLNDKLSEGFYFSLMNFFGPPLFLPSISVFLTGILLLVILCCGRKKKILDTKDKVFLFPILLILLAILIFFLVIYFFEPENITLRFAKPISFIIGLAATEALGSLIPMLFKHTEKKIHIERPIGMSDEQWRGLWQIAKGGCIVGHLERILYFIALLFNPVYIGGILTFKIAAKWEAWKNIVQVPQKKLEGFPSELSYFIYRKKLGSRLLNRVLVGTFSNILFAVVGYGFYLWFLKVLDP